MRAQVVLLQGDRILMARHERGNREFWVLPGGAVEDGESPEDAAVREIREEAGLEIALERLLFVDEPRQAGNVTIKRPRYTYVAKVVGGELRQVVEEWGGADNGRLAGCAWMRFEEPVFDESTRDTLRRVREAMGQPGL